jgi:class 3 adenylate cyclase
MLNKSNKTQKKRTWINYEASLTPYGCARLIERNEPLSASMVKVFSYLLEKFFILCNRKKGFHLFINPELDEVHYLYRGVRNSNSALYQCIKETGIREWLRKEELLHLKEVDGAPQIRNIDKDTLKALLKKMNFDSTANYQQGLLLPFDYGEINLGRFVIWEKRNLKREHKEVSEHTLLGWIAAWYSFLVKLFCREYRVDKSTYLPSYYSIGWKRAAILFADIRNFTPMTEMLRNAYSHREEDPGRLRQIVNEYCSEMARRIQERNQGRIARFMGDGVMAVFGEYDHHPSKIVSRAVYVACQMVKKFRELKQNWEEIAFGQGYELEFNEAVEIDLGIGIDFGTVLFDYLGDNIHREYSVVGDHVNFAQRLQGAAAKEDETTQKRRPPILISRTAFRCCRPWLNKCSEVRLTPRGKGYEYICYGIEPQDFNESFFITCENNDDWEAPWKGSKDGSPLSALSS